MNKDLKYFMRKQETEIVKALGPNTFKDENGETIEFEIKVLTQREIQKINNGYTIKSMATDKKGNPLISNGEIVWKIEKDTAKAIRHTVVEALQYPNLKDPRLMEYYNCVDITEMPLLVFSRSDEYQHVLRIVLSALGLGDFSSDEENLKMAKN